MTRNCQEQEQLGQTEHLIVFFLWPLHMAGSGFLVVWWLLGSQTYLAAQDSKTKGSRVSGLIFKAQKAQNFTSSRLCWSSQSLRQPQFQEEGSYTLFLDGRSSKEFIAVISLPEFLFFMYYLSSLLLTSLGCSLFQVALQNVSL